MTIQIGPDEELIPEPATVADAQENVRRAWRNLWRALGRERVGRFTLDSLEWLDKVLS